MELEIPPAAANRALWVVLTVWRERRNGEYVSQKVLASDHQLLDDTQVILGELALPAATPATCSHAPSPARRSCTMESGANE